MLNNFGESLLANVLAYLPSGEYMALFEDLFDLFKRAANSFRIHEEDVDERSKVEGSKDEVCFPGDGIQAWRDTKSQCSIKNPVCLNTSSINYGMYRLRRSLTAVARDTAFPRTFREY